MIAKLIKGRGFRGALEYDLQPGKGHLLDTNMAGRTPRELAAEFGAIRRLRPTLGKAVLHVSLAAAPGEHLSDAQWIEIGRRYLRGMGLTGSQYLITRHTDTEHEHIHILANRITHTGEVVSDGQDYRRQETLMREIERDYGLQPVAPSREAQRKAPTKGEIEGAVRTGRPSTRQRLQQLADAAALDCADFTTYQERLEAAGVELVPVVQRDGEKLSGLSYRLDGVMMKGSDLGRGYTPAGLRKRGIHYEKNRDLAAVRRCLEREASRPAGAGDRDPAAGPPSERGGTGRRPGTPGPGDGRAERGDAPDAGRDRPQKPGAGRDVRPPAATAHAGLEANGEDPAGRRRAPGPGQPDRPPRRPRLDLETVDRRPDRGADAYSGPADRILALAAPADPHPEGRDLAAHPPGLKPDRTARAVARQLDAFGTDRFEVGLREARTGRMLNREWDRAELEKALPWLRRMNAHGHDIYVRPAGGHGLILLDDLDAQALERMKADGVTPAALIETSPGNYQAWIKLSDKPLSADVRRIAAQGLAKQYDGDPHSADSRHYGRLAGFTNRKPEHARDGRFPYVLAHACPGTVAEAAVEAIKRIEKALPMETVRVEQKKRLEALKTAFTGTSTHTDPLQEYRWQARRLLDRYGEGADFSRLDWMIAIDMAASGRFTAQDIERAIRECSPHIEQRKAGHIEDYGRRTAEKAWNAPEVQAARELRMRHGWDREDPGRGF